MRPSFPFTSADTPAQLLNPPSVSIWTDGACAGNPGPGGWGAILRYYPREGEVQEKELFSGEAYTTNNRMELLAAINALEALTTPCRVNLYTDSQYLRQGISSWIIKWKAQNWRTSQRTPVKNVELWQRLDALTQAHTLGWYWVKGHAGDDMNERADVLARKGMQPFLKHR